jgi:hypothetical protein
MDLGQYLLLSTNPYIPSLGRHLEQIQHNDQAPIWLLPLVCIFINITGIYFRTEAENRFIQDLLQLCSPIICKTQAVVLDHFLLIPASVLSQMKFYIIFNNAMECASA